MLAQGADRTLLIVNPTTASTLLTEWAVADRGGAWILGPMLHTPGFLQNLPFSSLEDTFVLTPTLSLASECDEKPSDYRGRVQCRRDNEEAFGDHYARRWAGDRPFPAAHFYYDAVILLAMGLERVAADGVSTSRRRNRAARRHPRVVVLGLGAHHCWRSPAAMDARWRRLMRRSLPGPRRSTTSISLAPRSTWCSTPGASDDRRTSATGGCRLGVCDNPSNQIGPARGHQTGRVDS